MASVAQPSNVEGILPEPPVIVEVMEEINKVTRRVVGVIHSFVLVVREPNFQRLINEQHVTVVRPRPHIFRNSIVVLVSLNRERP